MDNIELKVKEISRKIDEIINLYNTLPLDLRCRLGDLQVYDNDSKYFDGFQKTVTDWDIVNHYLEINKEWYKESPLSFGNIRELFNKHKVEVIDFNESYYLITYNKSDYQIYCTEEENPLDLKEYLTLNICTLDNESVVIIDNLEHLEHWLILNSF